jgi:hypothetical protein
MKREKFSDLNQLTNRLSSFPLGFIFRGMANAKWTIRSKIDRELEYLRNTTNNELLNGIDHGIFELAIETLFLKNDGHNFQVARQNSNGKIEYKDFVELLVLIQHYNYPTRCVDFSKNWMKALYFCLEDKKELGDMAIYALNSNKIISIDTAVSDMKYIDDTFASNTSDKISNFYLHLKVGAYKIDTPHFTRIKHQEGLMIVSGRSDYDTVEDQIDSSITVADDFVKITIDNNLRKEIKKYLAKNRITKRSMYPVDLLVIFRKWNIRKVRKAMIKDYKKGGLV